MPEIPKTISNAVLNVAQLPLTFAMYVLQQIESRQTETELRVRYAVAVAPVIEVLAEVNGAGLQSWREALKQAVEREKQRQEEKVPATDNREFE